ncbi:MAG: TRAP transporter substrate-binding protein [Pseudomonadota bacterium]
MRQKSVLSVLMVGGILCLALMVCFLSLGTVQAKGKVIELKCANFFPPPSKQSKVCEEFINDLEARTDGRIKVQYFAGGSLLKGPAMYKGIETGIVDMGYSHVFYTPGRMPVTELASLPLGYQSAWVASHVLNDFYYKVQPKEWDNVKLLWLNGCPPCIILSTKPVRNLEDLKGLSLRAPSVAGDIVKALGGTPSPTPMAETYDAIAKGVNDGGYLVYECLKTWRLAEVVDYATICWQMGNTYPFYMAMNKNSYKNLPPDLKGIFDKLVGEYMVRSTLMWNQIDLGGKNFGTQKGVEYIELSEQEAARWKKAVEPVIDGCIKRMVGKGFKESDLNSWIAFLQERIGYYTKKQIEYRIPSATGSAEMRPENIGK